MTARFKLVHRAGPTSYRCFRPIRLLLLVAATLLDASCNSGRETGPTAPPGGTEQPPESATSTTLISIYPGQNIQAKVNSYPAGTRFLIKKGTYYNQQVVPKNGSWFVGEAGSILDGKGTTLFAFDQDTIGPFPRDVHIKGLVIQHYNSPDQYGAIRAGDLKFGSSTGWVIENCEIRYNEHGGIKLGNKTKVLNSFIHHNKQIGISGGGGDSVLVQGNEISFNNYLKIYPFGNVLGGAKFIKTRWLTVRGNKVHDNQGNGIWTDIANIYALVENNVVTANSGAGIMHEIGYDITIRNNTATKNGFARTWITGAGILISASANATVYGNTVLDNKQGIVGIQQKRTHDGVDYSSNLKNMYVHHNTVRVPSGGISGLSSGVSDLTYTSRNNRYVSNSYDMGSDTKPFMWLNDRRTKAEWQKYGNDVNGTFF
ncbi:MAG: right-handed parallel beta-helix repeat-containing protein [Gemmatimonadales bacterium]